VNDAFGTAHRAHASTEGIARYLPAYAGLLMEREITQLSRLLEDAARPFAAVVGGAKVSDKVKVLENLLQRLDVLVLGGGMANTFLVARGHTVGKSLLEADMVEDARRIIAMAEQRGVRLVLPVDALVAKEVTRGAEHKIVAVEKIPNSWSIVDIGPRSIELFEEALAEARTVLWNGPLGVFEIPTFGEGTRRMARYLASRAEAGATVVVGGGDSAAALDQQGLVGSMTHVSTGGGATLEFLEGQELPGIAILLDRAGAPDREPVAAR
jgi:phosphoglycerate kinase